MVYTLSSKCKFAFNFYNSPQTRLGTLGNSMDLCDVATKNGLTETVDEKTLSCKICANKIDVICVKYSFVLVFFLSSSH